MFRGSGLVGVGLRLPGRFAPCPPPYGLLLYLRKTPRHPDLCGAWLVCLEKEPRGILLKAIRNTSTVKLCLRELRFAASYQLRYGHMNAPSDEPKCPDCGGVLVSETSGLSLVVRCFDCDWAAATTNHNHPAFDKTRYTVLVDAFTLDRKKAIAILAAELNLSIEMARRVIDIGLPIAIDVPTREVFDLDHRLSQRGFEIKTDPPFRWQLPLSEALSSVGIT